MSLIPPPAGVSIHAPSEGSDNLPNMQKHGYLLFQSTLPVKGATSASSFWMGVRPVSIHAPSEGSDFAMRFVSARLQFQSTLPVKGATILRRN